MGGAVPGIGEEARLLTGERVGAVARRMNRHREQAHRDALARGHEHVHFTLGRIGIDAHRLIDEVIGRVAHCRDDHGDLVALFLRFDDALGHALDRIGIGDRRAAELLHDERHCYPFSPRGCACRYSTQAARLY